jgi:hypothetical protein
MFSAVPYRAELDVAQITVRREDLAGRDAHELGERSVEIGTHPDALHGAEARGTHAGPHEHAPPDDTPVATASDRDDAPAAIAALDQRERRRPAPSPVVPREPLPPFDQRRAPRADGHVRRVPAEPGVDIGRVDAGGEHPQQDLARPQPGNGHVAVFEHRRAAVSGRDHRLHGRRTAGQVETAPVDRRLPADRVVLRCHGSREPSLESLDSIDPEAGDAGVVAATTGSRPSACAVVSVDRSDRIAIG